MRVKVILSCCCIFFASLANSAGRDFDCSKKKICKQMISCEEAYYYLKECGHKERDGDEDGVPCENICGAN